MARWSRISAVSAAALATSFAVAPGAQAGAGGTAAPELAATSEPTAVGGTAYGAPLRAVAPPQPVARSFAIAPARVTAPALPAIRLRVDQPGSRSVRARLTFLPLQRHGRLARLDLGTVVAGRTVSVRWPSGFALVPGRYLVRLHVKGRGGQVLARAAGATGRANLVVAPAPVPAPAPAPVAPVSAPVAVSTPALASGPITAGVFPVQGPHSYGDGVGVARTGHTHQGQDVLASSGTPVVAPVAGTISSTSYQAGGAGYYVVENADDGRAFFFAHCLAASTAVATGQRVAPGTRLCQVGATGAATGPHLHFEIWLAGWRVSSASHFIDPLPQLRAWDR